VVQLVPSISLTPGRAYVKARGEGRRSLDGSEVGLVHSVHIRSRPPSEAPYRPAALTIWPGASAVQIERDAFKAARKVQRKHEERIGSERGQVTRFTRASRRNLRNMLATVQQDAPALLVTLTWPTWAAPDAEGWHRSWDCFRLRLRRAFPGCGGVWRREFTRAGTVHLHLLVYGVSYREMRRWLPGVWADCVDAPERELRERVGTSVEVPRRWHAVRSYIAKYCAKRDDTASAQPFGRWWGVFGQAAIPFTRPRAMRVTDDVAVKLIRTGRRFLDSRWRAMNREREARGLPSLGKRWDWHKLPSLTLVSDPGAWWRLAQLYGDRGPPGMMAT